MASPLGIRRSNIPGRASFGLLAWRNGAVGISRAKWLALPQKDSRALRLPTGLVADSKLKDSDELFQLSERLNAAYYGHMGVVSAATATGAGLACTVG